MVLGLELDVLGKIGMAVWEMAAELVVDGLASRVFGAEPEPLVQDREMAIVLQDNRADLTTFLEVQGQWLQLQQAQAEATLAQNWQLAREQMALQVRLQELALSVGVQQHQETLAAQHQAQQIQIQADWDRQKMATVLSRNDLEQFDPNRPLVICSKLRLRQAYSECFRDELADEVAMQLREMDANLFGAAVQFHPVFFDAAEISETHALQVQPNTAHIPTFMVFGEVSQSRVSWHCVLWGSELAKKFGGKFHWKVNWRKLDDQLRERLAAEGREVAEMDRLFTVVEWISAIQKLYTCYLLDCYALVDGPNPLVELWIDKLRLDENPEVEQLALPYRRELRLKLLGLQRARLEALGRVLDREREAQAQAQAEELERQRQEKARQEEEQRKAEEQRKRRLDPSQPVILQLPLPTGGIVVPLELLPIPGGTFWMGQTEAETRQLKQELGENYQKWKLDRELPRHRVTVLPFWMGRYPVTQAQYKAVMGENPATRYDSKFVGPDLPVVGVSWDNAVAFCQKLTEQCRDELRGGEIVLPTEAQWEYACRAGTETAFYFGDRLEPHQANFDGNYTYNGSKKGERRKVTTPVGSFPANTWGLQDMHGNVWEWCWDEYRESYNGKPEALKQDGSIAWLYNSDVLSHNRSGQIRVLRGGSWDSIARYCRSTYRGRGQRNHADGYGGFRVLLSSKTP